MKILEPDIRAIIHLFRTEDGGKKSPIRTGYKCPIELIKGRLNDAIFEIIGKAEIAPGESGMVGVTFFHPELVKDAVIIGKEFTLWEIGDKGVGKIIEIVNFAHNLKEHAT